MSEPPVSPPASIDECHRLIAEQSGVIAKLSSLLKEQATLRQGQSAVNEQLAATCEEQRQTIRNLKEELDLLKRFVYGRRSERRIDGEGQGFLFAEPAAEVAETAPALQEELEIVSFTRRKRAGGANGFPEHLPRVEEIVDLPEAERCCGKCGEEMAVFGEDASERLAFRPARVYVRKIRIKKRSCGRCQNGVHQPPAPASPIAGGRYDFGVAAQVVTSKFADHLPLYRQQDILARCGIELSRSTLCDIVASSSTLLFPLASLVKERLLASEVLGADDTPVRLQDPAIRGSTRTARIWSYYGMDGAPYIAFDFREDRRRDGPAEFLKGFQGWVKVDAYGVDDGVYLDSNGRIRASCCMAHARRKFHDTIGNDPVRASYALATIGQLYEIEERAKEFGAEERAELRRSEAKLILDSFHEWLLTEKSQVLPKSGIAKAIQYTLNQWDALITYVDDGRLPIDNNATERSLRGLAIGRKNWMFLGSAEAGERAATLYTVVASAARHDLDVWTYLDSVMRSLASEDAPLQSLLPDAWKESHPEAIRTYRGREREQKAAAKRERHHRRRALEKAHAGAKQPSR